MDQLGELLLVRLREALVERDRFQKALRRIADINNGPDKASGEWRCAEAADIAIKALAP